MLSTPASVLVRSWCCVSESERRAGLSVTGRRSRESLSAARRGESDMASVQKIKLSPSRDIPFNKLVLSQSNVRRVKAGVSIEQLAESIAQRTLYKASAFVRSSMPTAWKPACSRCPPVDAATARWNCW
jgi:hypothetical protein